MGGSLESIYYAFGQEDVYLIASVPDHVSAAAIALTVNASGAASVKTTILMTPEEVDQAAKKTVSYRRLGTRNNAFGQSEGADSPSAPSVCPPARRPRLCVPFAPVKPQAVEVNDGGATRSCRLSESLDFIGSSA